MENIIHKAGNLSWIIACLLLMSIGCQKNVDKNSVKKIDEQNETAAKFKNPQTLKDFVQVNLVGDNDEYAPARIDPNFVNGWGMAFVPSGPIWISTEGTGLSVVYNKDGNELRPPVTIPSPGGSTGGHPSGQVFNGTSDFKLPNGNPARFIFAGLDGVISGWNGGNAAIKMIDDSPDAVYTGIALAADGGANFLYAANFSEGKIDVYDKDWAEVEKPFTDPGLPNGYSPFNIQNIDGRLYVMYAKIGEEEEEVGPGNGYVDIYNADGTLLNRFISRGQLNAPWGIAKAPAGFWGDGIDITDVILVGNFGDGRINAFTEDGKFLGQLRANGNPIIIEGLWAISFAPGTATTVDPNWLFFAAGPDDEEHGLFGYITK